MVVCTNAMFLLSSKRLKKIPTQLACVARETPRKRALVHGEAAKPAEKKRLP